MLNISFNNANNIGPIYKKILKCNFVGGLIKPYFSNRGCMLYLHTPVFGYNKHNEGTS